MRFKVLIFAIVVLVLVAFWHHRAVHADTVTGDALSGSVGPLADVCVGEVASVDVLLAAVRQGQAPQHVWADGATVDLSVTTDQLGFTGGVSSVTLPSGWGSLPSGTVASARPVTVAFRPLAVGSGDVVVSVTGVGPSSDGGVWSDSRRVATLAWSAVDCAGPTTTTTTTTTTVPSSSGRPFFKIDPQFNTSGVDPTAVTLRWGSTDGLPRYEVCVDQHKGNVCDTEWVNVGPSTTFTLPPLRSAARYHWQVRAITAAGVVEADGGDWSYFRTVRAPSSFRKGSVSGGYFSWGVSQRAVRYEICVDGSLNGRCDGQWVDVGVQRRVPVAAGAGSWQVRAVNGAGVVEANGGQWGRF